VLAALSAALLPWACADESDDRPAATTASGGGTSGGTTSSGTSSTTSSSTSGQGGAATTTGAGGGGESGWRSALYPASWTPAFQTTDGHRIHDFSYAGYQNGEAPIGVPVVSTTYDVVAGYGADSTGGSDATAPVQAAIDAAATAGGGVVVFPAGLYRFDGRLWVTASNVVLRGAGSDQSKLYFTSSTGMSHQSHITFRGALGQDGDLLLAYDAPAYGSVVELWDASSLSVGDDVVIGWQITSAFVFDHQMAGTWDNAGAPFFDTWQPFFRRQVIGVDTSTAPHQVTLDVPLRYPALGRDSASLRRETGFIEQCGIEELSLGNAVAWSDAWAQDQVHVLQIEGCKDCWMRNVASFDPPSGPTSGRGQDDHLQSGGLIVRSSKRVTIADSELSRAEHKGGGGNGYLFEVRQSSEVLFRDLVADYGRHGFIENWGFGVTGCVWLRVESAHGNCWINESFAGLPCYSEFHHSLSIANLIDSSRFDDGWSIVNRGSESTYAGHTGTQNVIWNTSGNGLLRSRQQGWGYVVGTDGSITVQTDPNDLLGTGIGTAPEDWTEGIGDGATLRPQSLYEDQLARRLGR
jgi:hypothetical protein